MNKIAVGTAEKVPPGTAHAPPAQPMPLSEEDQSKDEFFVRIAALAEAMIARHGKDFTMGTLLLTAKFIAEGKPLIKRTVGAGASGDAVKAV
jgi:hypothetical protein